MTDPDRSPGATVIPLYRARAVDPRELIARARRHDPAAQRSLVELHRDRVAAQLQRMTGAATAVDDLVQDVFIAAFARIDRFPGDRQLHTWLYGLANEVARAWWSRDRRRGRREQQACEQPDDMPETPHDQLERVEQRERLYAALGSLPAKQREPFVALVIEGLSDQDVAEALGLPGVIASERRRRAEERLCQALGLPHHEHDVDADDDDDALGSLTRPELRSFVTAARAQELVRTCVTAESVHAGLEHRRRRQQARRMLVLSATLAVVASLIAAVGVSWWDIDGDGGVGESETTGETEAEAETESEMDLALSEDLDPAVRLRSTQAAEIRDPWTLALGPGTHELELQPGAAQPLIIELPDRTLELVEGRATIEVVEREAIVRLHVGVAAWIGEDGSRTRIEVLMAGP